MLFTWIDVIAVFFFIAESHGLSCDWVSVHLLNPHVRQFICYPSPRIDPLFDLCFCLPLTRFVSCDLPAIYLDRIAVERRHEKIIRAHLAHLIKPKASLNTFIRRFFQLRSCLDEFGLDDQSSFSNNNLRVLTLIRL